jgi:hypothetical protein
MYYINDSNISIKNSCEISKKSFQNIINEMRSKFVNSVLQNRSDYSLKMEWAVHNFLYNLGIQKSRTKDIDLNYPQKCYEKLLYNVFGPIAWLLIR